MFSMEVSSEILLGGRESACHLVRTDRCRYLIICTAISALLLNPDLLSVDINCIRETPGWNSRRIFLNLKLLNWRKVFEIKF